MATTAPTVSTTSGTLGWIRRFIREAIQLGEATLTDAALDAAIRDAYRIVLEHADWEFLRQTMVQESATSTLGYTVAPVASPIRRLLGVRRAVTSGQSDYMPQINHMQALEMGSGAGMSAQWSFVQQPIRYYAPHGSTTEVEAPYGAVYLWPPQGDPVQLHIDVIPVPPSWPSGPSRDSDRVPIPGGVLPPGLVTAIEYMATGEAFLRAGKLDEQWVWRIKGNDVLERVTASAFPSTVPNFSLGDRGRVRGWGSRSSFGYDISRIGISRGR